MESNRATQLRDGVRRAYSHVATHPRAKHPFPIGQPLALSAGYPAALLATMPADAVDSFAGVSHITAYAELPGQGLVLDLGCGAGLDTLLAAKLTGPQGWVIGVDFSPTMLDSACRAAQRLGQSNVTFVHGEAEQLPLADGAVDVALVNGIFNLNPARTAIFGELARVVRPGGRVYAAELVLTEPVPEPPQIDESNWFA